MGPRRDGERYGAVDGTQWSGGPKWGDGDHDDDEAARSTWQIIGVVLIVIGVALMTISAGLGAGIAMRRFG